MMYIGIISNGPAKFLVNELKYCKLSNPVVINICPYIPINNDDEDSAYSTILIHTPWPLGGEDYLLDDEESAVSRLRSLIESDEIPQYVSPMLKQQRLSSNFTENQILNADGSNGEAQVDLMDDENEYIDNDSIHESQGMEAFLIEQQNTTVTEGIFSGITSQRVTYYRNFIQNAQNDYMDKQATENQLLQSENSTATTLFAAITNVNNFEERSIQLEQNVQLLTKG